MAPVTPYPANALALLETDDQLRALMPVPGVSPASIGASTLPKLIETVLDAYTNRPAIGCRKYEIGVDPETGRRGRVLVREFNTISYGELGQRTKRLAAAWRKHPQHRVDVGEAVCILGFSGVDYATIDLACVYAQAVSVPLQVTVGGELRGIVEAVAPVAIAATIEDIATAAEMAIWQPSVRSVIAFDYDPNADEEREQFERAVATLGSGGANAKLITLSELGGYTTSSEWRPLPPTADGLDRVALLVHSSGSTGQPKGAIMTERLASNFWIGAPEAPLVRLAYAPMNHMLGRGMIYGTLARGGSVYVTAKPDLSTLFEDFKLVRPTDLALFPRLLEMIHRHFLSETTRLTASGEPADAARERVMREMRAGFLGDRVCLMSCSAAPTSQEVKQFMAECFGLPLHESYGLTEAGMVMLDGRIRRPPIIDYKLRDVPELGYFSSDKPYPRGELCFKSETAIPGYFKAPEATARLFDEQGYLCTGDIMEERAPDHLVFLDRANDVVKLSQGEFVAIGALGVLFESACASVLQIYLYASAERSCLLAVIVPDMEAIQARLGERPDEIAARALVRAELNEAAGRKGLRAVETPRDFIIELEPFSFENGLLTSVRKRKRAALKERYGAQLERLYAEIDRKQEEELRALRSDVGLTVEAKILKALAATLGVEVAPSSLLLTFGDLGGDSLSATTFATLLSEIFGVDLSVSSILSPAGSVSTWARLIEARLQGETAGVRAFDRIHRGDRGFLHAKDLDIGAFLDADLLDAAEFGPPPDRTQRVLLTGATGFLGRFLCLEWLERMRARDGKVICLIRGPNQEAAMARLRAGFASDAALAARFAELAGDALEILVGDVAEPRLGLDDNLFDHLARSVDHIVHCGALVNHMLPYSELFAPNVAGTAQLAGLALAHRQKKFDFISTVGVAALLEAGADRDETTPLMASAPVRDLYAAGYSNSKWAAEHVLRSASNRFGLPVNIFRCNMILAHPSYAGQFNLPDLVHKIAL